MANKIKIKVTAEDQASAELKKTQKALDDFDGSADKASRTSRAFGFAADAAKVAVVALGVSAAAAAKFAVSSAAEYEQSLNIFRSVSGATAEEMVQVGARSRELGKDLALPGVSAADAALAMVELGKAGLSVNDTMAASRGVLSLAKAGQMETAQAAEIAANALNAFGLKGSEASRVADILAAAANASSADVTDLAYSLQMSSAGAAAVKVPIDNLVASIGLMANNGIKGSDAGTSLKTMFMNLIPMTDKQHASFKQLNLDFYDTKGNFVGLREMIRQLEKGTKNLTDEQKAMHVETIFGSDSSRAANILIKEGVKGYDAMTKAVNKTGAATDLAAAQNSGFKGALDGLKSTLETIAIDVGMKMLPALTLLANTINAGIEPAFYRLVGVAKEVWTNIVRVGTQVGEYLIPKFKSLWNTLDITVIPSFKRLWDSIQPLIPIVGAVLVVAVGALTDGINFLAFAFSGLVTLTAVVIEGLTNANPIVWTLVGAFSGLAAVMAFNAIFNALKIGFVTLQLITIPNMIASVTALQATIMAPIAMPAIAIGAALAAIAAVVSAFFAAKSAIEQANQSIQRDLDITKGQIERNARIQADGVSSAEAKKKSQALTDKYIELDRKTYKNATGTGYSPGGRTLVGENGPEIVNMPQGAQVIPAYRTRNELNSGGEGVTNILSGTFHFANAEASNAFFDRIDNTQRLAKVGM